MKRHCANCIHADVCSARIAVERVIYDFKRLAMTEKESKNCGTQNTADALFVVLGGSCTAYKELDV